METKSLLYGLIGFFIGGLLVSIAATTFNRPSETMPMTTVLKGKTGDEFDKAFLDAMIIHHNDAVEMSKLADERAKHQEIKTLSDAIITAQEKEILEMKDWQMTWGYESTSRPGAKTGH